MNNIIPAEQYEYTPCTIVACGCALDFFRKTKFGQSKFDVDRMAGDLQYHDDGYLSLQGTNKLVRSLFKVRRGGYHYFKRGERPKLSEYDFGSDSAIVMVYGHCIFVDKQDYYSFFDNENDNIVAIWVLEGEK
jgi:hypothetical protein